MINYKTCLKTLNEASENIVEWRLEFVEVMYEFTYSLASSLAIGGTSGGSREGHVFYYCDKIRYYRKRVDGLLQRMGSALDELTKDSDTIVNLLDFNNGELFNEYASDDPTIKSTLLTSMKEYKCAAEDARNSLFTARQRIDHMLEIENSISNFFDD